MKKHMPLVLAAAALTAACHGGSSQPTSQAEPAAAPAASAVAPMSPADRRAAAVPIGPSLYTRLGGMEAIRAVVDDFIGRVAADDRINAFFRGVDIPNLKRLLAEQICSATGGPCVYSGRSMRVTHTGLNLTDDHFNALVQDLVAALERFNVPAREKGELLGALAPMKGDIVGH
jgi:hemoglobin